MTADTPLPLLPDVLSCDPRINGQLVHHIRTYAHAARAPLLAERSAMIESVEIARERAERAEARLAEAEGLLKEARRSIEVWCDTQDFMPDEDGELLTRIDAFLNVPQS